MVKSITSPQTLRWLRFVVLAVWLIAVAAMIGFNLPTKFDDAQENESSSFLPGDAESTTALERSTELQGAELAPIVVVYQREGGLTDVDTSSIEKDRTALNSERMPQTSPYGKPVLSPDGSTALLTAEIKSDGESDTLLDPVDQAREQVGDGSEGLQVAVTGGAGFSADAIKVFESINGTLLGVTALIVFLLLLAVYRSPVFWFFPLLAVGFAELSARAAGFGLSEIGVTINGQSAGILPILVFGAGTDYALLLVARYREELRRHEDKHEAMAIALRRAGPAILASGGTVIAALLCLTLADVQGTAGLGPIGSVGIFVAMVAMLTALPAAAGHGSLGLLAVGPSFRRRDIGRRDPRYLEPDRRADRSQSPQDLDRDPGPAGRPLAWLGQVRHRTHPGQPVSGRRRVGRGPAAPPASLPQRRLRAD